MDELQPALDEYLGAPLPPFTAPELTGYVYLAPDLEGAATLFVNLEQLIISEISGLGAGAEKEDFRACARRIIAIVRGFTP